MADNKVTYYESANWAYVDGNFTPDELRQMANEIEEKHKQFKETKVS